MLSALVLYAAWLSNGNWEKRNGMLGSSEQPLMGRSLDTKSSYKGDMAPQNNLKIKCPRLAKNAFAMQHLLHHSIIYTFIHYEWRWMHFWAHSYRTGNILSIGYKCLVPWSPLYMEDPRACSRQPTASL
jgi:hypothetical protein